MRCWRSRTLLSQQPKAGTVTLIKTPAFHRRSGISSIITLNYTTLFLFLGWCEYGHSICASAKNVVLPIKHQLRRTQLVNLTSAAATRELVNAYVCKSKRNAAITPSLCINLICVCVCTYANASFSPAAGTHASVLRQAAQWHRHLCRQRHAAGWHCTHSRTHTTHSNAHIMRYIQDSQV